MAGSRRVGAIVHPGKVGDVDAFSRRLTDALRRHRADLVECFETSPSDAGSAIADRLLQRRPDVIVVCGGDGTVNAVASSLAHSEVPLAIVPMGTGNLIARNLEIPGDIDEAIELALTGTKRSVDLGVAGNHRFVGMAGMGLDAAMARDADPKAKRVLGWPAYVRPAVRAWRAGPAHMDVRCDGASWTSEPLIAVVVGNVGRLQGGLPLLPDAEPDDGRLDAVLVRKVKPHNVLMSAGKLLIGSTARPTLETRSFRRIEIRSTQVRPFEVDGDAVAEVQEVRIEVDPGALVVMVPPWDR